MANVYVPWEGYDYSIGISSIDEQHEELRHSIDEIYKSMSFGKSLLLPILDSYINQIIQHFSTEERLMKQYDYPEFALHKKEHSNFLFQVSDLEERFKENKVKISAIIKYLAEWLLNHIVQHDMPMGEYMIDNSDD
jgi:hemerythrin